MWKRNPPQKNIKRNGVPKSLIDDLDKNLQEKDNILSRLKEHMSSAQSIMKRHKDSKIFQC